MGALELHQVAQRGGRARMHRGHVFLPVAGIAGTGGTLQRHDHVGVVHVVLAAVHVLEQAAHLRLELVVPGTHGQLARLGVQPHQVHAADPRRGVGKAQVHHVRVQPDDLEQLRAAVAGDGADAHLGDDLGQALVDALAVAAADLRLLTALAQLQDAAPAQVEQGLVGQVRVHRGGADAEQAGHVVRVARGAGLDDQVDVAAQAHLAQVVMHRAGGQQRMRHRPVRHRVAVGQQQHHRTGARCGFHLLADAFQPGLEAFFQAVGQVDQAVALDVLLHLQQLAQFALAEHRRIEDDVVHRLRTGVEDIGLPAELCGERHRDAFAQRVDRRVGDLRERLAEVVVQRPGLAAEHRHRGVVAHRAGGFLLGFCQRAQHLFHFLGAELEQLVIAAQGLLAEGLLHQRGVDQFGLQIGHALLQPLLVRGARTVDAVDGIGIEQVAALEVDRHHLARAQLALAGDALGRQLPHAGFGGHQEVAVGGQHPARRAQAVAVEHAGRVAAVAGDDAGRAVPRFGVEAVELVERGQIGVLELQRLSGRRHQDAQRLQQVHATGDQQLQHVVQALRIGAVHGDHRIELRDVEARGLPYLAARLRPAPVAFDGVDFPVVREQPERMRQRPARQRVGGKTLVEDNCAGGQIAALQVRVERAQLVRQHHALVADAVGREGGDVEMFDRMQRLLGAPARQEQRQGEAVFGLFGTGIDKDLFDARQGIACQLAAHAVIGGHHAPAAEVHAGAVQLRFQFGPTSRSIGFVQRQEHHTGCVARAQGDAGIARQPAQERIGFANQQAAAIASEPVGGDTAAVGHARERRNRGIHQRAGRLVVQLGDHAKTTGVALVAHAVVETVVVEPLASAGGHVCLFAILGERRRRCSARSVERSKRSPDDRLDHS
ncbi:hypothetical protein XAPC_3853 [Xanthomonas citri pv. punicae str. LMG 859]|nr:hypothetical protein XAPC_3853 [Xanthomonas citri pv. punicae str. LMG 859]